MRIHVRAVVLTAAMLAAHAAAGSAQRGAHRPASGTLRAFASGGELNAFLAKLATEPQASVPPSPASSALDLCASVPAPTVTRLPRADTTRAVVAGRVTDTGGNPLARMVVSVGATTVSVASRADGTYRLVVPRALLNGGEPLELSVAGPGWWRARARVAVAPGDSVAADFRLCPEALVLESLRTSDPGVRTPIHGAVTGVPYRGVDEGGIVKVHGEHLVILRGGRLFTVAIGDGALRPVAEVDAYGPGAGPDDVCYDEMLVWKDVVVVIGYSHSQGGIQLEFFDIDGRGALRRRGTRMLRADDYHTTIGQFSRLVNDRLVLYTPAAIPVGEGASPSSWLPAMGRWRPGADRGLRPIAVPTRIHFPARRMSVRDQPVLHAVTVCGLRGGEPVCKAGGVVAPPASAVHVSATAVYVWVSDWVVRRGEGRAPSMVYRLPLDGSAPTALGVRGKPFDELSFLESGDGHLNVLVRADSAAGAASAGVRAEGGVALLRVPLASFGDGRADAPAASYRTLPRPTGENLVNNRFVGAYLLYGSGRESPNDAGTTLYAVRWADGRTSALPLPHAVHRIEAMGGDAVVAGARGSGLHFTAVRLGGSPAVADGYRLAGAPRGELRGLGAFYGHDGERTGVVGLPVPGAACPAGEHRAEAPASVVYLRNDGLRFQESAR